MDLASKVTVNTTLAAGVAGLVVSVLTLSIEHIWSVPSIVNGVLAGLVSITGPCAVVSAGASICIGVIGAVVYFSASRFLVRVKVDDPLDAWAVHGVCGAWGVLSVAIFANSHNIEYAGYNDKLINASRGQLFSNQLLAVVMIIIWVVFWIGLLFYGVSYFGYLRVSKNVEILGLDIAEHGGKAVDFKTSKVGVFAKDVRMRRRSSVEGSELEEEMRVQMAQNRKETQNKEQDFKPKLVNDQSITVGDRESVGTAGDRESGRESDVSDVDPTTLTSLQRVNSQSVGSKNKRASMKQENSSQSAPDQDHDSGVEIDYKVENMITNQPSAFKD